jgi:hypothetical protein
MGGTKIGPWLSKYAKQVEPELAIVELGTWLGAGTYHLGQGSATVYSYDRFRVLRLSEIRIARKYGVPLRLFQNTLPLVQSSIAGLPVKLVRANLRTVEWQGPKIGLFVDDASKRKAVWEHTMNVFKPHLVPGCFLFLMDYFMYEKRASFDAQKRYMEGCREFDLVESRLGGTSCALFRYVG